MGLAILDKIQRQAEENMFALESAQKEGRKIVGFYCLYTPKEIAIAANAIPLGLCGTKNDPIVAAEEHLPRNLCPLIKSSYDFALTGTCPFFKTIFKYTLQCDVSQ